MSKPPEITGIYRYPVKGLTPEQLARTVLSPGQTVSADRRYAIENGPSGFDPADPKFFPKAYFLMLMRNERLAGLQSRFDDASNVLTIRRNGTLVAHGDHCQCFLPHARARALDAPSGGFQKPRIRRFAPRHSDVRCAGSGPRH